jgi:signal transduction histidine kinase
MNLFEGVSNLVVSLVIFCVGVFVFIKGLKKKINQLFFVFTAPVSLWLLFYGLAYLSNDFEISNLLFRCGYGAIAFIPAITYHFTVAFLNKTETKLRLLIHVGYLLAVTFMFLLFLGDSVISSLIEYSWGYYPKAATPGHIYFLIYFNVFYSLSVLLLFFGFWRKRDISSMEQSKRKYVFIAWMIGTLGALDFIQNYEELKSLNLIPLGFVFMSITYCIIAYAIVKYRLMDIRVFITRAVAFLVAYPFLLSIPFYFGYRMYPFLEPVMGRHWWLIPAGLLAFIATLAPLAYEQLKGRMEARLLVEQKRYQKLLLQAASGMVTEHDLGRLAKLIVYIVKRIVNIRFAVIFLDDKKDGVFRLRASRNTGKIPYKDMTFNYEHPLIRHIEKNREPFLYEELPQQVKSSLKMSAPLGLIVPCATEQSLLGFVFLGEKQNRQPYSEDDINVFNILSNQAALAVENCIFLEEFKQAQERIFTAEKLASIGGMADGVAHQIKNRLNQFSVASGELKYEIKDFIAKHPDAAKNNPDLQKTLDYLTGISESLIKNVKRTDSILRGILNFARVEEKESYFGEFSLKEVIDLSVELLRVKHEITQAPLSVKFDSSDAVYGVKPQVTEVIYNIIDNAYEAIQERRSGLSDEEKQKFSARIEIKLTQSLKMSLIQISDNGIGIKKEDRHKIFAPFYTTKSSYKSGTGIGMYVVRRMIEENHGGRVWFASTYGEGTTFFIELPKK